MNNIKMSSDLRLFLRLIPEDEKENITMFYNECIDRDYKEFDNIEMALMDIDNGYKYKYDDMEILSYFSGFEYSRINAAARDKWYYQRHGNINDKPKYEKIVREITEAIDKNQNSVGNIKVFRGVDLSYFSEYGISSLEDLEGLKGGFLLDEGFVSTSLIEDNCFYRKTNNLGLNYNVKIEYLVPEEFGDGVALGYFSHHPDECEYLINSYNMAQVVDVNKDGVDGAVIQAMLIPKYVYDKAYRNQTEVVK